MHKELFTGAQLLVDEGQRIRFGMVGAFGPNDQPGTVRLTLAGRAVDIQSDEEDITVEFPEAWALQLGQEIIKAVHQLEHLRVLRHLQLLADTDEGDATDG